MENQFGVRWLKSAGAKNILKKLLSDSEIAVRIAAAQALYFLGEKEDAIEALKLALTNENPFASVQACFASVDIEQAFDPRKSKGQ